MKETLERLVELQQLDEIIRDLAAEIDRLPREVAQIEGTLAEHIARVEADKKALSDNQKSRRKREGDIAALRGKISHFKDQSLLVKTNEQYKAMLHEIEYHEQQIRNVEDQILAEMEESETLEARLKEAERNLVAERVEVARNVADARARKAEDDKKLSGERQRRAELQAKIEITQYERYERVFKAKKGLAVAPIVDGSCCGACHVHLRPQALNMVLSGAHIVSCETCDRILYFIPPPPVEPVAAGTASENSAK